MPAPLRPRTGRISDLLSHYAPLLVSLKSSAPPLPAYFDDLWLLRFLVSAAGRAAAAADDAAVLAAASAKLRVALEYRRLHEGWLASARDAAKAARKAGDAVASGPALFNRLMALLPCGYHEGAREGSGSALFVYRLGETAYRDIGKLAPFSELFHVFVWAAEAQYAFLDGISRDEGVLTRAMYILDMSNLQMFGRFGILNPAFHRVQNALSKHNETHYPALEDRLVVVNAPWVARKAMRTFEGLAPSYAKKVIVCPQSIGGEGPGGAKGCPFAERSLQLELLPTFLGGDCTHSERGGCMGSNSAEEDSLGRNCSSRF